VCDLAILTASKRTFPILLMLIFVFNRINFQNQPQKYYIFFIYTNYLTKKV